MPEYRTGLDAIIHKSPSNDISAPLIQAVRVIDIILSSEHPEWEKYGGWDSLGLIKFVEYYGDQSDSKTSINIARPLFANIKQFPLLQEITYVLQLPDPTIQDPNFSAYYYINSINLWNHPHHNAFPNIDYSELPSNLRLDYKEVETGIVRKQADDNKSLVLGKYFTEKPNIKPLLPFEGDSIYEGRWGQSIRFGSTAKDQNTWSTTGNDGDPIIMIRNGQSKKVQDPHKGWIPTLEDINGDGASMFMCDGQSIPINVASKNQKSFSTQLTEADIFNIQLPDNPLPPSSSTISSQDNLSSGSEAPQTATGSITTSSLTPNNIQITKSIYSEEDVTFSFPGEEQSIFIFATDEDEESSLIETIPEKYNKDIMNNEGIETKNAQGEYALYSNGKIIEYSAVTYLNQIRVAVKYEPQIRLLLDSAKKEGIPIRLNSGLRTFDEQLALRKQNVKDKTKVNDLIYLKTAVSSMFNPMTGKPGFSNHQNGRAFDINTGDPSVYKWMVKNALKYGFIRTVLSERWHWEYLPNTSQFAYVPKDNATWDKLV